MPKGVYIRTVEMYNSRRGMAPWNKNLKNWCKNYSKVGFQKGHKNLGGGHKKGKPAWNKGLKGFGKWNKGLIRNEETIKKLKLSHSKEKHWNWQGGISYILYPIYWTVSLKKNIRERDNYTCQICFKNGWCVHHIDYNKENCKPNNLITLCSYCHGKTNYKREYWKLYFYGKSKDYTTK